MKLYAPEYYKNFTCIADRCEHSCCIGWEIDVDEESLRRYQCMKGGYGVIVKESIADGDMPHFRLDAQERCPHLDANGLCRIILNLGEEYLSDICREHPRFYNFTEVAEVGIGLSCPEAARVVLSSPYYHVMEEIGEVDAEEDIALLDGRAERRKVYEILRDGGIEYTARLERIRREYRIPVYDDAVWLSKIASLEYLEEDHKKMFMTYSSKSRPAGAEEYLERSLAYFIYRHCTEAVDEEDFSARLQFCLFCESLLASLILTQKASSLQEIATLARILSEEIEYSDENTESLSS